MLDAINSGLQWSNHWTGRLAFLLISTGCGIYFYRRIFSGGQSFRRVMYDFLYSKAIRRFTFARLLPTGWTTLTDQTSYDENEFDDSPVGTQYGRVSKAHDSMPSDNFGLYYEFEQTPPKAARFIEFIGRPAPATRISTTVDYKVAGDPSIQQATLTMGVDDRSEAVGSQGQWSVPNLKKNLGSGWVSYLCDVPGWFKATLGNDGNQLVGIKSITVHRGDTWIKEIVIRGLGR